MATSTPHSSPAPNPRESPRGHRASYRDAGAARKVVLWAALGLAVSIVLIAIKVAAFGLTGSAAILSDALESCIHIVTSGFALFAVWLAAQPQDENHPYGHGKVEYFAAFTEGCLVSLAGVAVIALSAHRLVEPQPLHRLDVGVALSLVSATICLVSGTALARAGRRYESPTLEADGVHIRSDAITSFGAFCATLIVMATGAIWVDSVAGIGLGIVLVLGGAKVVRRAVGGLMDEALPEVLARIADVLLEHRAPGWIAPHACKIHRLGQSIHIDLHLVFPRFWELERAHDTAHRVEDALRDEFGERTEVMLHYEPCTPKSCTYCDAEACPVRDAAFVRMLPWTGESIARRRRPGPIEAGASGASAAPEPTPPAPTAPMRDGADEAR